MARGMNMMGGLLGLAAVGGVAWWFLGRTGGNIMAPMLPIMHEDIVAGAGVQSAAAETLAGLKASGTVPVDATDVLLIPGLGHPLARIAGLSPTTYAIPSNLTAGGSPGLPALMSGYGRPNVFVGQRTTPSMAHPQPGTLTMMTTPSLPAPRSLSGGSGFGQPVSWHAGQLYQPGTHDTSSGVTGLWY